MQFGINAKVVEHCGIGIAVNKVTGLIIPSTRSVMMLLLLLLNKMTHLINAQIKSVPKTVTCCQKTELDSLHDYPRLPTQGCRFSSGPQGSSRLHYVQTEGKHTHTHTDSDEYTQTQTLIIAHYYCILYVTTKCDS